MVSNKKILGVITARGGSKGLPGKNIKILGGKPLIAYSIEAAKQSELITHLIVSTDYEDIAQICRAYGADVPFLRPAELATDKAGHLEVMQHAIDFMEKKLGIIFDYVVILQPTSPFRSVEDLDETLKKLIDSGADSAVSLVEMRAMEHPIKAKKLEGDKVLSYCIEEIEGTRRQDLPKAYKRSGAVYAMRRDLIMKDNRLYGDFIVGHIVPQERSVDIDDELDWLKAEYMLEKSQNSKGKTQN
jgi:CMP-N,N'-diacetyllegionaminic acid synthase